MVFKLLPRSSLTSARAGLSLLLFYRRCRVASPGSAPSRVSRPHTGKGTERYLRVSIPLSFNGKLTAIQVEAPPGACLPLAACSVCVCVCVRARSMDVTVASGRVAAGLIFKLAPETQAAKSVRPKSASPGCDSGWLPVAGSPSGLLQLRHCRAGGDRPQGGLVRGGSWPGSSACQWAQP